ncbi:unnamed protein product, partial [marine sediment metagenome]
MPWSTEVAPGALPWGTETADGVDSPNNQWRMPSPEAQHLRDTVAVEHLNVNPEDMTEDPEDTQGGARKWTVEGKSLYTDDFSNVAATFDSTLIKDITVTTIGAVTGTIYWAIWYAEYDETYIDIIHIIDELVTGDNTATFNTSLPVGAVKYRHFFRLPRAAEVTLDELVTDAYTDDFSDYEGTFESVGTRHAVTQNADSVTIVTQDH